MMNLGVMGLGVILRGRKRLDVVGSMELWRGVKKTKLIIPPREKLNQEKCTWQSSGSNGSAE